ncbi:MAG: L7Ae/L30e/S12e/Gadd45 family ribosomal protein [Clostridia bacterium]|nr:L7Ae/L30e/S12e/Gadd45 family ribosomal protein [Clostridia bacterium]
METSKVLSLLGFSKRAGKLVSGANQVLMSIEKHKAKLVVISSDTAKNTVDRISRLAEEKGVRVVIISTNEELSRITGEENRGTYAVLDRTFSEPIISLVDSMSQKEDN